MITLKLNEKIELFSIMLVLIQDENNITFREIENIEHRYFPFIRKHLNEIWKKTNQGKIKFLSHEQIKTTYNNLFFQKEIDPTIDGVMTQILCSEEWKNLWNNLKETTKDLFNDVLAIFQNNFFDKLNYHFNQINITYSLITSDISFLGFYLIDNKTLSILSNFNSCYEQLCYMDSGLFPELKSKILFYLYKYLALIAQNPNNHEICLNSNEKDYKLSNRIDKYLQRKINWYNYNSKIIYKENQASKITNDEIKKITEDIVCKDFDKKFSEIINNNKLILFGEIHFTNEIEYFFADRLPLFVKYGVRNFVFEIPNAFQKLINQFLEQENAELDLRIQTMRFLIAKIKEFNNASETKIKIFCTDINFDNPTHTSKDREKILLSRLQTIIDTSNDKIVAILGNYHIQKKALYKLTKSDTYPPLGTSLNKNNIVSINFIGANGYVQVGPIFFNMRSKIIPTISNLYKFEDSSILLLDYSKIKEKVFPFFMNSDFPITYIKPALIPVEYSIVLKNISVVDWRNLYATK